jgi:hypothetical protein
VVESTTFSTELIPEVTAALSPAPAVTGKVGSIGYTKTKVESEQPTYHRSQLLDLVGIDSVTMPLKDVSGPLPKTLKTTRHIENSLIAGQEGPDLLNITCGPGTVLVLDGCSPAMAQGTTISCSVGATAMRLPDSLDKLLGKRREPHNVDLVRSERAGVPIDFSETAEMVSRRSARELVAQRRCMPYRYDHQ